MIEVPLSPGDLVDRLSILAIKLERFSTLARVNVEREHHELSRRLNRSGVVIPAGPMQQLSAVNQQLWTVEEELRACEEAQRFDQNFINLARSVYQLNDQRSALKRQINLACGSPLLEEKNYRTGWS
jgi:hypothetical protein